MQCFEANASIEKRHLRPLYPRRFDGIFVQIPLMIGSLCNGSPVPRPIRST